MKWIKIIIPSIHFWSSVQIYYGPFIFLCKLTDLENVSFDQTQPSASLDSD